MTGNKHMVNTFDCLQFPVVGDLLSPHVGQTVLHSLATPEKVEHPQILEHGISSEHLSMCTGQR